MAQDKVQIYASRQKAGLEYRWRFLAANGKILADSAESYKGKRDALNGIYHVIFGDPLPAVLGTYDVRVVGHADVEWLDENGEVVPWPESERERLELELNDTED